YMRMSAVSSSVGSFAGQAVFLQYNVVRAAFHDACRGYERNARLALQLLDRQRTAVAHRRFDFMDRLVQVFLQAAGVRHIRVDAFLEHERLLAACVVALPVARPVGPFAPKLLDEIVADLQLARRTLVEAGK